MGVCSCGDATEDTRRRLRAHRNRDLGRRADVGRGRGPRAVRASLHHRLENNRHLLRRAVTTDACEPPSGTLLDQLDVTRIAANPALWSRAYRQLQAGAMPPVGAPRPDRATAEAILVAIEQALGAQTKPPATASSREIATRLASMLWNSAPDAALLQDGAAQSPERSRHARAAGPAHARRRSRAGVRLALLRPVAAARRARQGRSGQEVLPRVRRLAARFTRKGDRALSAQSTA